MSGRVASFFGSPERTIPQRRRSYDRATPTRTYSSYGSRNSSPPPLDPRRYSRSSSHTADSSRNSNFDDASTSSSGGSRLNLHINLSTGSPSDKADGNVVDREIEKLRRLSVEWARTNELEDSQAQYRSQSLEKSPSPRSSPQRNIPIIPSGLFSRTSSRERETPSFDSNSRSPSPTQRSPQREERPSFRRSISIESEAKYQDYRARSPSPKRATAPFNFQTPRSFSRSNSQDSDSIRNLKIRSPSPRERLAEAHRNLYRRSSSYDGGDYKYYSLRSKRSPSPHHQIPSSAIFRRSSSYDGEEKLKNFRPRSTSPHGLNPALSYYRKANNIDDGETNGFIQNIPSRSPSPQRTLLLQNLFKPKNNSEEQQNGQDYSYQNDKLNSYKNVFSDALGSKFNTLSRARFQNRSPSPISDNIFSSLLKQQTSINNNNILNNNTLNKNAINSGYKSLLNNNLNQKPVSPSTKPPIIPYNNLRKKEDPFLPNSIPELPPHKMTSASQRRFSEEPTAIRRPLATLHEDEISARRRFSDDLRKKSYDTTGVLDEYYEHQRRMSEAGVRKISDASVVLTEDTDSFIIGDRVWVGGTKPGVISYIGETQFAPGDWAGVTLDDFIGKNDGSVGGVRYFQCESKKGVFSRLTRLSRTSLSDDDLDYYASRAGSSSPRSGGTPAPSVTGSTRSNVPTQRKLSGTTSSGTQPNSNKATSPTPVGSFRKSPSPSPAYPSLEMKIGDRVVISSVNGVRHGTLRYTGKTEFAEGLWAGVELDDNSGKNNGSVAGKRYFVCKDKYGLFAPLARVSRFATPSRRSSNFAVPAATQSSLSSLKRTGSKESVGASSVASSTTASQRGLRKPSRPSLSGTVPSTKALQEALLEKTQHVDQLINERDMERTEVARMASQTSEAKISMNEMKKQLDQLQIESEERLHDFGENVRKLEEEKKELSEKLAEFKRENEELLFRVEEESIAKQDIESQSMTEQKRLQELEAKLMEEVDKNKKRVGKETENIHSMEETELSLRESVEEMQARIIDLERDNENMESQKEEEKEKLQNLEHMNSSMKISYTELEQKMQLIQLTSESNVDRQKVEREIRLEFEKKMSDITSKYDDSKRISEGREIELKLEVDKKDEEIEKLKSELSEEMERQEFIFIEKGEQVERQLEEKMKEIEDAKKYAQEIDEKLKEGEKARMKLEEDMKAMLIQMNEKEEKYGKDLEAALSRAKENETHIQNESSQRHLTQLNEYERKANEALADVKLAEVTRKKLESQLENALSSSTSSSDMLCTLNKQLRDAEAAAETAVIKERGTLSELQNREDNHEVKVEEIADELEASQKIVLELTNSSVKLKEENEQQLKKHEEDLGKLMQQNEDVMSNTRQAFASEKTALEVKLDGLNSRLDTLKDENISTIKKFEEEMESKNKTLKAVDEERSTLKEKLDISGKQLATSEGNLRKSLDDNLRHSDENKSKSDEFEQKVKTAVEENERKLNDKDKEIENLREVMKTEATLMKDLKENFSTQEKLFEQMKSSTSDNDKEFSIIKEKLKDVQKELNLRNEELLRINQNYATLEDDMKISSSKISDLEIKLNESNESSQRHLTQLNESERKANEALADVKSAEIARKKLESQLEDALSTSTSSSDQLCALNIHLREAETATETAVIKERSALSELESQKEKYESKIKNLVDELESYRKNISELTDSSVKLKDENEQRFESCREDLCTLKQQHEDEMSKVKHEFGSERSALEARLEGLNSSLDALQNENISAVKKFEEKIESKNKILKATDEEMVTLKEKLENSEKQLATTEENLKKNLDDKSRLYDENKLKLDELEQKLKTANEDSREHLCQLNESKRQLEEATARFESVELSRSKLEQQLADALSSSTNSSDQLCELNKQLRDVEATLELAANKEREISSNRDREKEAFEIKIIDFTQELEKSRLVIEEGNKDLSLTKDRGVKEIENLNDNIRELEKSHSSEVKHLQIELDDVKKMFEEKVEDKDKKLKHIKEEKEIALEKYNVEMESKTLLLNEKIAEIATINKKMSELELELNNNKRLMDEMEEKSNKGALDYEDLNNKMIDLKQKWKLSDEVSQEQLAQLNKLKRKLDDTNAWNLSLEETRSKLEQQLQDALSTTTSSSDQLCALNRQLRETEAASEASIKKEQEAICELERERSNLSTNVKNLTEELEKLELTTKQLNDDFAKQKEEFETEQQNHKDTVLNLENVNSDLVKSLSKENQDVKESFEMQLKDSNKEVEILYGENELIKKQLELKSEALELRENEINKLQEAVTKVKNEKLDEINANHEVKRNLTDDVKELSNKISNLNNIIDEKTKQLEEKSKLNDTLQHKLEVSESERKVAIDNAATMSTEHKEKDSLAVAELQSLSNRYDTLNSEKNTLEEYCKSLDVRLDGFSKLEQNNSERSKRLEELEEELKTCRSYELELSKQKDINKKLESQVDEFSHHISSISQKAGSLETAYNSLSNDKVELNNTIESINKEKTELNMKFSELSEEIKYKDQNIEIYLKEKENLKIAVSQLEEKNKALKLNSDELSKRCEDREKSQGELNLLNSELSDSLKSFDESNRRHLEEISHLNEELKSLNLLQDENKKLLESIHRVEEEKNCLRSENEKLEEISKGLDSNVKQQILKFDTYSEKMDAQFNEIKLSYEEKVSNLQTEKSNLIEEVVELQERNERLRQEAIDELSRKNLKSEESLLAEVRLQLLQSELAKRELTTKVSSLQEDLALLRPATDNDCGGAVSPLKDERDMLKSQVDFLNSLIVDLQRDKEKMSAKIEILQTGDIPSGDVNGMDSKRLVAPRLFCDICDCFDLHDTEDCPTQENDDPVVPHSRIGADRTSTRPYCTTCEVFGHEDGECPEDETF